MVPGTQAHADLMQGTDADVKNLPGYKEKEEALKKAQNAYNDALEHAQGLPEDHEDKCKKCKGTGKKVIVPDKTASDDKANQTQPGAKTKADGSSKDPSGSMVKRAGGRRRLAPSTESILCSSRIRDSAETILSRRRRLIGDSKDPPALRELMMRIVESSARHLPKRL